MTAQVVIVQQYVPKYRVAFFEALRQRLAEDNVECRVAAGVPRGDQAARGDAVRPDWLIPVRYRSLSVAGHSMDFGISPVPWRSTSAVVLGLEGSSLPVYQAMLSRQATGVRLGLWGHVRPYVNAGNKIDLWLEKQQMRLADHVFAYTEGGAKYALTAGINPDKVTTVMNSLDTTALEFSRDAITPEKVAEFSQIYGIDPSKTFCFIGGLDASKRVDFLADACDELWRYDRNIRIIVAGKGPQKQLLDKAIGRGQVINLGYATADLKALAMSASLAILMPGRIGLIAVDALVMKRPIITTQWEFHAPEAEYLTEGTSLFTTKNDLGSYVSEILRCIKRGFGGHSLTLLPKNNWHYPTIEVMVQNYARGIYALLD